MGQKYLRMEDQKPLPNYQDFAMRGKLEPKVNMFSQYALNREGW